MKRCTRCGDTKDVSEFYRDASRSDGLSPQCKACCRVHQRAYRQRVQRDPSKRERRNEATRQWRETNREKMRASVVNWQRRNRDYMRDYAARPEEKAKQRARTALKDAIKRGEVVKPSQCAACGAKASGRYLQAHHDNYDAPLDVTWLCATCHKKRHMNERAG